MERAAGKGMSIAFQIAEEFGNDVKQCYRADGAATIDGACGPKASSVDRGRGRWHFDWSVRYDFPDGSVIVVRYDRWDLGYPAPAKCHCEAGRGHVVGCAELSIVRFEGWSLMKYLAWNAEIIAASHSLAFEVA